MLKFSLKTCLVMSYHVLKIRIFCCTCLAREKKNGGKGGWTNFCSENPKNEFTCKCCLFFDLSLIFEKSMFKNPLIQNLGLLFDDFEKLYQKDSFSFLHLEAKFSLVFLVSSCVHHSNSLIFFALVGKNHENPSTTEDHSQISTYVVSIKSSST